MGILDRIDLLTAAQGDVNLSEDFLENTKLRTWGMNDLALVPGEYGQAEIDAMTKAYKRYRLRPSITLPTVDELELPKAAFHEIVVKRRTIRSFSGEPFTLPELTTLLHLSGGVTGRYGPQLLRASPSAGGLFPVEIYLSVRNVTGLEPGLYHYDWPDHAVARLADQPSEEEISRVCCMQPQAERAAVVVFLAGMIQRTVKKYGDRGLRYVLLDAGHLAQNLCLTAAALDLACMTTCGFYDDEVNDLFGLDGLAESALYVAFLGRPDATASGEA